MSILLPSLWVACLVGASIWFRRHKGKSIFPKPPVDALFAEKGCSGRSLRNWLSKVGGASRCLVIYVAHGRLVITPQFPFNLMFLPEVYGLDVDVPLAMIRSVTPARRFIHNVLRIEFINQIAPVEVVVDDELALVLALGRHLLNPSDRTLKHAVGHRRSKVLRIVRD